MRRPTTYGPIFFRKKRKGRFETIRTLLAGHAGGARSFVKKLDDGGLAHLSWSKVSCVESCPYGYYLEG